MKYVFYSPGEDLTQALAVRYAVFVEEQGFSADTERDDIDAGAHHLLALDRGRGVATGRLFPDPDKPGTYIIGRVAVLREYRGTGLGRRIMEAMEQKAKELGASRVTLGAQLQAKPFYEKNGYRPLGDVYMDEHCPHEHMEKLL